MAKTSSKQTGKPDCLDGQPCGDTCISQADSCIAFVARTYASAVVTAARAADKVQLAATVASTALSFTFPLDLMPDGDAVTSAVSDAMAYSGRMLIARLRLH